MLLSTVLYSFTLQISWEDCNKGGNVGVRISVDGTDFRIEEPSPFNRRWYSHKYKGPGLRYEIGICIRTGFVVWINGPFPCGEWSDLKIFKAGMRHKLDGGEKVVADNGYPTQGLYTIILQMLENAGIDEKNTHKLIQACHEIINR